ncbi:hypothetical protein P7C73_g5945, partial [Tremellales sp. Uapishka_1]
MTDFAVYIFDWGTPVFFRLFDNGGGSHFTVRGIITQNGNLYEDGLGMPYWANRRERWDHGTRDSPHHREKNRAVLANPLKGQYVNGTPDNRLDRLDPSTWMLDYKLNIQGREERLLDMLFDYGENVRLYPVWQAWLKASGLPILMWGKNDPAFIAPGAKAFKTDIPETELVLLDGGHFVLETHLDEAVEIIRPFLRKIAW